MNEFKILINNREYTSYEIFDTNNKVTLNNNVTLNTHTIVPFTSKLFTDDIFSVDENNQVNIVHSSIRSGPPIPAVL